MSARGRVRPVLHSVPTCSQQTFSIKDKTANVLGCAARPVSAPRTHPATVVQKQDVQDGNKRAWLCPNKSSFRKVGGGGADSAGTVRGPRS